MLFLQALLFFILGISVVAIPISPMISDISPRSNNLNHHSGQQSPHTTGGVAKLEYPKDGLWTGFYCPPGGGTHETYYMKIIRGDVVGFWPKLDNEEVKTELFKNNDWNREEDLESTRKVSDFPLFENLTSYTCHGHFIEGTFTRWNV